jgi:hypothetical protein
MTSPAVAFAGRFTIWICTVEEFASSWRCWRGPRTAAALERELQRERRAGRRAHLEVEATACSPVALTVDELVALGIVQAESASEVRS